MEILDGNSFSNYRMGKILFTQNSFEISYEFMKYRDVLEWKSGKMVMFMKNAQCPSTMETNPTLCDHIYHIWEKA